jgi:hypothetical protein
MTYQQNNDTESATGRRTIELTPAMIEAGARELVFDSELIRTDLTEDILRAALTAGGFKVVGSGS